MHAEIVVLPGDGIGPEVAAAAVAVLDVVAERFGHTFGFQEHDMAIHGARACFTPVRTAVLCPLWLTWCSTRNSGWMALSPCSTARVSSREWSSM